MAEKTAKINNTQRREFAKIADRMLEAKMIEAGKDEWHEQLVAREKAAEALTKDLDASIAMMEKRIESLQKEREALGFSKYDHIIPGSKADQFIQEFLKDSRKEVARLRQFREEVKERLWASQTLDEAQAVMVEVREL